MMPLALCAVIERAIASELREAIERHGLEPMPRMRDEQLVYEDVPALAASLVP